MLYFRFFFLVLLSKLAYYSFAINRARVSPSFPAAANSFNTDDFLVEDHEVRLSTYEIELIKSIAASSTSTPIEASGRRMLAVIYIKDGGSYEMLDLFLNFLQSCVTNAPEFTRKKLLVAAFDATCADIAKSAGISNIIHVYNGSTSTSSSFKFRLVETLLSFNISVLLMEADQVVLQNPFIGLSGDCDIELASDYTRPTLAFNDIFALDKPLAQATREIADSANIGLILMSPTLHTALLVRSMIESDGSILARSKPFVWDQKRFNLYLHAFLGSPATICYLNGTIIAGKWLAQVPCRRTSRHLLLRLLPMERYPLGPAFMWGKLHCNEPGRDSVYLEQFTDSESHRLPKCGAPNEMRDLVMVHAAGLLDISKIYFFRDRDLWFLPEHNRFENRLLVSVSPENTDQLYTSLSSQLTELVQLIAWTIALGGDLVLPQLNCNFIPNGVEVWRIGRGGNCSLDHFLRLSLLGNLLNDAADANSNRTWNTEQKRQRLYNNIPYIEHSLLSNNSARIQGLYSSENSSSASSWIRDAWGSRLIEIKLFMTSSETVALSVQWFDGSNRIKNSTLDDQEGLNALIEEIKSSKNHHINLIGLTSHTSMAVFKGLAKYMSYAFENFDIMCTKIREALFCNPWQIFFDKFPIYYHGTGWNIVPLSQADRCGLSSLC